VRCKTILYNTAALAPKQWHCDLQCLLRKPSSLENAAGAVVLAGYHGALPSVKVRGGADVLIKMGLTWNSSAPEY